MLWYFGQETLRQGRGKGGGRAWKLFHSSLLSPTSILLPLKSNLYAYIQYTSVCTKYWCHKNKLCSPCLPVGSSHKVLNMEYLLWKLDLFLAKTHAIFSHLVQTENSEEKYKSISYAKTCALLVEAIKELRQEVDELRSQIETLKKKS